jgi:hypothetical protein
VAAAEGNGVKVGPGRLHPFLEVEGRYDSNVVLGRSGQQIGDLVFHFRPGFNFEMGNETVAVNLSSKLDWAQFTGVERDTTDLSRLYAEANLGVGYNRAGTIGIELAESFRRSDRTPSISVGTAVVSNLNDLGLKVPIRPGGGALVVTPAVGWQVESFEPFSSSSVSCAGDPSCDPTFLDNLGYHQLSFGADARWKFFPRTALVFDTTYFRRIPFDEATSLAIGGLKLNAGLAGLVSTRLAATVKVGYGDTFGTASESYRTWLANAELEYLTQGVGGARIGYLHDFHADPGKQLGLYGLHRIYGGGKLLLLNMITLQLTAGLEFLDYPLAPADASTALVRVSPSVDIEVAKWLYAGGGYTFTNRASELQGGGSAFEYSKHEVWLMGTVIY